MDGMLRSGAAADWLRLVQTVSLCGRQLRRVLSELGAPHGLSDADCLILWACCEAPPEGQGQQELVNLVGVSPAQLSGLVEQLSANGWIVGRRPAHDRRRQYWRLTAQGQSLVGELIDAVSQWLASADKPLNTSDQRVVADRLHAWAASLAPLALRGKEAA